MVIEPTNITLEMYNTYNGEFIRSISGFDQEAPLVVHCPG